MKWITGNLIPLEWDGSIDGYPRPVLYNNLNHDMLYHHDIIGIYNDEDRKIQKIITKEEALSYISLRESHLINGKKSFNIEKKDYGIFALEFDGEFLDDFDVCVYGPGMGIASSIHHTKYLEVVIPPGFSIVADIKGFRGTMTIDYRVFKNYTEDFIFRTISYSGTIFRRMSISGMIFETPKPLEGIDITFFMTIHKISKGELDRHWENLTGLPRPKNLAILYHMDFCFDKSPCMHQFIDFLYSDQSRCRATLEQLLYDKSNGIKVTFLYKNIIRPYQKKYLITRWS
jgi:hypothetical protein